MRLVLELDVADLAATRFAVSPLAETLRAVQLLATTSPPAVNRPWVRWARAQLDRQLLRMPRLWPLLVIDAPWPASAIELAERPRESLAQIDLHPDFRWAGRELLLTDAEESTDTEITLGPDGLVLVPSVFIWPQWSVKRATSTQTTLSYQARGSRPCGKTPGCRDSRDLGGQGLFVTGRPVTAGS